MYIGAGKQGAGWMKELLEARDRNIAAPTFDPNGLYLTSVEYDAKWNLPGASVFFWSKWPYHIHLNLEPVCENAE